MKYTKYGILDPLLLLVGDTVVSLFFLNLMTALPNGIGRNHAQLLSCLIPSEAHKGLMLTMRLVNAM